MFSVSGFRNRVRNSPIKNAIAKSSCNNLDFVIRYLLFSQFPKATHIQHTCKYRYLCCYCYCQWLLKCFTNVSVRRAINRQKTTRRRLGNNIKMHATYAMLHAACCMFVCRLSFVVCCLLLVACCLLSDLLICRFG